MKREQAVGKKGPFYGCRDDWQLPGPSGPATKRRHKKMTKPPFEKREAQSLHAMQAAAESLSVPSPIRYEE